MLIKHRIRFAFVALLVAFSGCSKDDEDPAPVVSQRGEACQSTSDCAASLACVGTTGNTTCQEFDITVTSSAKTCQVIECEAPADCCAGFVEPSYCADYRTQCTAGTTSACTSVAQYCECHYTCTANQCVQTTTCTTDTDCSGAQFCNSGTCGGCTTNEQCQTRLSTEYSCVSGACTRGCTMDAQCPVFYSCASGTCVEHGCEKDRECVSNANPSAFCDLTALPKPRCTTHCTRDSECGGSTTLGVCTNGVCQDAGCETDDECRNRSATYRSPSTTIPTTGGGVPHIVCRDKPTT